MNVKYVLLIFFSLSQLIKARAIKFHETLILLTAE